MTVDTNLYDADLAGSTARTSGWVIFSATIAILAAATNLLYGITLLVKDDWLVITSEALVRFDTTTIGVIELVFSVLLFAVAIGILGGHLWARVAGIMIALFNLLSQMAFLSLYPAWSWLVIVVDGLIIYGLTVHGHEVAEI